MSKAAMSCCVICFLIFRFFWFTGVLISEFLSPEILEVLLISRFEMML